MTNDEIARAFSGHRFEETFAFFAPDITWIFVGQARLEGSAAVIDACRRTVAETADVETSWLRFVSAGNGEVVAVDAIGRYDGPDGATTVSSCDIYDFSDGKITRITSYAVELGPEDPPAPDPDPGDRRAPVQGQLLGYSPGHERPDDADRSH